jgi:hypothetical protein
MFQIFPLLIQPEIVIVTPTVGKGLSPLHSRVPCLISMILLTTKLHMAGDGISCNSLIIELAKKHPKT